MAAVKWTNLVLLFPALMLVIVLFAYSVVLEANCRQVMCEYRQRA